MGTSCLIDTNILIYHLKGDLPEPDFIQTISRENFNISVITKIEFLGWSRHTDDGYMIACSLLDMATVRPLTDEIIDRTIELKRKLNIKLPDAVIAATCLEHKLSLVTRNDNDFLKIPELSVINPFK